MLVRGGCNIDVGQYLLTLVSGAIFGRFVRVSDMLDGGAILW